MRLQHIFESSEHHHLIVMSGGFHPWHAGHTSLYNSIVQRWPEATALVAATNDQKERPFPFAVKQQLAQLAGVPSNSFVQVSKPFNQSEYMQYAADPTNTILVFVRSEKDRDSHPKAGDPDSQVTRGERKGMPPYILDYEASAKRRALKTMDKHAYITYMPTIDFETGVGTARSATQIRQAWTNATDAQRAAMAKSMYPDATASQQARAYELLKGVMG